MHKSRALGFWETFKAITHDLCYGFETICMSTRFTGKMDKALFAQALEFTYNRHPLLQARIVEKDAIYYYVFDKSFEDIPVQFIERASEELFEQCFLNGINASLEPEKYLWKVEVYHERDTVFFTIIAHHSPCDGRSLMNMVDDILYAYSCYLEQTIPNRPNFPLLPPTEHLLEKNLTRENYLQLREELLAFSTQKNSILSLGPQKNIVPIAQRKTHILYKELSQENTARVLNFCAKNQLSSNSLLNGLILFTAQRIDGPSLSLAMLTPVHTRPPIEPGQVGCHVCLVTTLYEDLNPHSSVLELSQDYQSKLKQAILKQTPLPKEFNKSDVYHAFGLDLGLDFFKYQLVISNLGETPVQKKYGNNIVENIQLGVNNRVGAISCALATYIVNNKIQLGFVYTEPLVSKEYIKRFSEEFMRIMYDSI